jgi:AcrR family transcriptional regulator
MAPRSSPSRAEHRARSRDVIIDAALELFATRGYDDTTTEEIAERAGISPRTFFRYFPTKEAVAFDRDYGYMRAFPDAFLAQPPVLSDYDAILATFLDATQGFDVFRSRITLYRAAIASSTVLVGREQRSREEHADTIALAIARRHGREEPDGAARTLAIVALVLFQRALTRWLTDPDTAAFSAVLADEFATMAELTRSFGSAPT